MKLEANRLILIFGKLISLFSLFFLEYGFQTTPFKLVKVTPIENALQTVETSFFFVTHHSLCLGLFSFLLGLSLVDDLYRFHTKQTFSLKDQIVNTFLVFPSSTATLLALKFYFVKTKLLLFELGDYRLINFEKVAQKKQLLVKTYQAVLEQLIDQKLIQTKLVQSSEGLTDWLNSQVSLYQDGLSEFLLVQRTTLELERSARYQIGLALKEYVLDHCSFKPSVSWSTTLSRFFVDHSVGIAVGVLGIVGLIFFTHNYLNLVEQVKEIEDQLVGTTVEVEVLMAKMNKVIKEMEVLMAKTSKVITEVDSLEYELKLMIINHRNLVSDMAELYALCES